LTTDFSAIFEYLPFENLLFYFSLFEALPFRCLFEGIKSKVMKRFSFLQDLLAELIGPGLNHSKHLLDRT